MLCPLTVWQYSKALETESPRFSQPGDFFIYVIFLGLVVLVSCSLHFHHVVFFRVPSLFHLAGYFYINLAFFCPLSLLAAAVPGAEEDCPCSAIALSFAINLKGYYVRCRHGGNVN